MSGYRDVVTQEEAEIMAEASEEARKIKERLAKSAPTVAKFEFAKMGPKKREALLSASISKDIQVFSDLIKKARHYYEVLKKSMDSGSTHEFITEQAIALIGITDAGLKGLLKDACMDPDREKKLWELAYEGHFYGKINGKQYGNFWPRVLGPCLRVLHLFDDDIEETALSNFTKYYGEATRDNLEPLGWAIHYLQDMTAPHHVGNMAIFLENITDNNNSHHAFEKHARKYVYQHKEDLLEQVHHHFEHLKQGFDPEKPQALARTVFQQALVNVPKVKVDDTNVWDQAVQNAIPLAIAATAVVLEPWKKP